MKTEELKAMTDQELHEKLLKLDKVISTHPQKTMRAKAGSTKSVVLNELQRRQKP